MTESRVLMTMIWVTAGRVAVLGLWFVGLIVIYRNFGGIERGLEQAGAFALALAMIKICSSFVGDTVDLEVMRRVPSTMRKDTGRAYQLWRIATTLRVGSAVLLGGGLFALSPAISTSFLESAQFTSVIRLAAAGIVGELLVRGVLIFLQSIERFGRFIALEAALQIGRLTGILLLIASGQASAANLLAAYVGASFLAAGVGILALPRALLWPFSFRVGDLLDALHYTKWILLALGLAALNERVDILLVNWFHGPGMGGLYGAVLPLALMPDVIGGCLAGVIQPKVINLYNDGKFGAFFVWISRIFIPCGVVACVIVLLLGDLMVEVTIGPAYAGVVPAFKILAIGALVWLAVTPLPVALVALKRPRIVLWISVAQSIAALGLGLALIPTYGALGAAIVIATIRITFAIVLAATAWSMVRDGRAAVDLASIEDSRVR